MEILEKFKKWFCLKPQLAIKESKILFKQGKIWWCSLGMNVGEEIYGKGSKFKRPVLVFKKFTSNSFLALPLTSKEHQGSWYVEIIQSGRKNWVMLNQARVLDQRRLTKRITCLEKIVLKQVREKFIEFYGL